MSSQSLLSSEQALDDYFTALLEESVEEEEILVAKEQSEGSLSAEPEPEP